MPISVSEVIGKQLLVNGALLSHPPPSSIYDGRFPKFIDRMNFVLSRKWPGTGTRIIILDPEYTNAPPTR